MRRKTPWPCAALCVILVSSHRFTNALFHIHVLWNFEPHTHFSPGIVMLIDPAERSFKLIPPVTGEPELQLMHPLLSSIICIVTTLDFYSWFEPVLVSVLMACFLCFEFYFSVYFLPYVSLFPTQWIWDGGLLLCFLSSALSCSSLLFPVLFWKFCILSALISLTFVLLTCLVYLSLCFPLKLFQFIMRPTFGLWITFVPLCFCLPWLNSFLVLTLSCLWPVTLTFNK